MSCSLLFDEKMVIRGCSELLLRDTAISYNYGVKKGTTMMKRKKNFQKNLKFKYR